MTFDEIITSIKNKVYYPIYYLHGDESYFIDEICRAIDENVLTEAEKDFNQTVVYGRDIEMNSLIAMLKRYPMMANHQVVMVKEAQNLKNIDELNGYAENPQKSTILVLCHKYGKLDGRKKITKVLKAKHVLFESKKLYENEIPGWIEKYLKSKGYGIFPEAAMLLSENLGDDLSRVANEIEKLFISLPTGTKINKVHIEENIGISKEYNVFELQRALGQRDVVKANKIIFYFASDPKRYPALMVIPILFNYFLNLMTIHSLQDKSSRNVASALSLNPYFVPEYMKAYQNYTYGKLFRIIGYLRDYDMKAKGWENSGISDGEILKEMIFKILH